MTSSHFRLRECRERAGMTQDQLGQLIGLYGSAISRYERGHVVPSFARAADIAIALGCSLDDLAGIEEEKDDG